jgi:hypothetical protein
MSASLEEHPRAAGIRGALRLREKLKRRSIPEKRRNIASRRARRDAEKSKETGHGFSRINADFFFS